jgi:signal transduction histidine kinase
MLTAGGEQPLPRASAQPAEEIAGRMGASLRLSLDEGVVVPPTTREELVRVVREAVSNATRHGRASGVIVELEGGQQLTLRVRDDGCGFDPQVASTNGFGLTSMRERAEALGGRVEVRSRTGGGTEVEVIVPWNGPSGS